MIFKKGNTYSLKIPVTSDEENIDINEVEKAVFKFNDVEKEYPSEEVSYDETDLCFIINLTQKETLSLKETVLWEVGIKYTDQSVERTEINRAYSLDTIIEEEI